MSSSPQATNWRSRRTARSEAREHKEWQPSLPDEIVGVTLETDICTRLSHGLQIVNMQAGIFPQGQQLFHSGLCRRMVREHESRSFMPLNGLADIAH